MEYSIVKTNIINVVADAIVLPANTMLKEGSGTSTAIFQAAGRKQLTKACEKIGSCEVGSAVPTLAFNLDAKYIIHAVVPKWIDGEYDEYELLCSAYLSALKTADFMECNTIAFPLLASGNNGYSLDLAFQIAKESIESFSSENLQKAILVVYGERVTAMVKAQGYDVIDIPENIKKDERKLAHQIKRKQLLAEGKELAANVMEELAQKVIDYLGNEENREYLWVAVGLIVKNAKNYINSKEQDKQRNNA